MLIKGAFWIGLTWLCLGHGFQLESVPAGERIVDAREASTGDSTRQAILQRLRALKAELKDARKKSLVAEQVGEIIPEAVGNRHGAVGDRAGSGPSDALPLITISWRQ